MTISLLSRYIFLASLFLCALSIESIEKEPPFSFSFSFEKFDKNGNFSSQIILYGDAEIRNSTVVMFGKAAMMYERPIMFFETSPSFSIIIEFLIIDGEGLGFLMVPHNLSLIPSDGFLAVKFGSDRLAIDASGEIAAAKVGFSNGEKLCCWIDYEGVSKIIEVRVSKSKDSRPSSSIVSHPIDLSNSLWRKAMYVGISSSSVNSIQASNVVYSWNFKVKHGEPYLMHSEPLDPESFATQLKSHPSIHLRRSFPWKILSALLIGSVLGALVASLAFHLRSKVIKRHPVAPVDHSVLAVEIGSGKFEEIITDGKKVVGNDAK